jgi:hypothetical protein
MGAHCSGHSTDAHAARAVLFWHRGPDSNANARVTPRGAAPRRGGNGGAWRFTSGGRASARRHARGCPPVGRRVARGRSRCARAASEAQAEARRARSHRTRDRRGIRCRAPAADVAPRAADHRAGLSGEVLRVERPRHPPPPRLFLLAQTRLAPRAADGEQSDSRFTETPGRASVQSSQGRTRDEAPGVLTRHRRPARMGTAMSSRTKSRIVESHCHWSISSTPRCAARVERALLEWRIGCAS